MTMLEEAMNTASLWAIGICFFILLGAASWVGTRLRRVLERGSEHDSPSDGYLLSAALALLGLLLAFTFSLALNRYDTRRAMVVEEGNAISTAWLRATLAEGPQGEALRQSMKRYVDIRLRLPESQARTAVEAQSAQAQSLIWRDMRAALPSMQAPLAATLVTAITEMFDAAASRKAERLARIPGQVLVMVSLYALLSAGIVGYVLGQRGDRRHAVVSMALFLLLSLAFTLILDLDRPWSGSITISPQPVIDARAAMN
jgi:hypothetical protein